MLTIRLQRIGKKGQPSYRLVVAERRSKLGAPPTEDLGSYNPFTKEATFKADRVNYWLGVGALPTVTTHNLLVNNGILDAPKRKVYMKQAVVKPAEPTAESAPTEASAPKEDSAPADAATEPAQTAEPAEPADEPAAEAPKEGSTEETVAQ